MLQYCLSILSAVTGSIAGKLLFVALVLNFLAGFFGPSSDQTVIIALGSALIGGAMAMCGSYLSTRLLNRHQKEFRFLEIKRENRYAAARTQFALLLRYQLVHQLIVDHLDDHRDDGEERYYNLQPFAVRAKVTKIPVEHLSFMTEENESANLLNEIVVADQRYETLLYEIERRNQIQRPLQDEHAATLNNLTQNLRPTETPSMEKLKSALIGQIDIVTKTKLIDATDSVYDYSCKTRKFLENTIGKLENHMKKAFPGEPVLTTNLDPRREGKTNEVPAQPQRCRAAK